MLREETWDFTWHAFRCFWLNRLSVRVTSWSKKNPRTCLSSQSIWVYLILSLMYLSSILFSSVVICSSEDPHIWPLGSCRCIKLRLSKRRRETTERSYQGTMWDVDKTYSNENFIKGLFWRFGWIPTWDVIILTPLISFLTILFLSDFRISERSKTCRDLQLNLAVSSYCTQLLPRKIGFCYENNNNTGTWPSWAIKDTSGIVDTICNNCYLLSPSIVTPSFQWHSILCQTVTFLCIQFLAKFDSSYFECTAIFTFSFLTFTFVTQNTRGKGWERRSNELIQETRYCLKSRMLNSPHESEIIFFFSFCCKSVPKEKGYWVGWHTQHPTLICHWTMQIEVWNSSQQILVQRGVSSIWMGLIPSAHIRGNLLHCLFVHKFEDRHYTCFHYQRNSSIYVGV